MVKFLTPLPQAIRPPLPQAMNLASIYISEEDVTALVTEVDMDGDGLIDFREFRDTVLGF